MQEAVSKPKSADANNYYAPTTQPHQHKIFINECNGYIGSQLVQVFRNDDEVEVNPNIICGTRDTSVKTIGDLTACSTIEAQNRRLFNAVIKDSDIIVYTLHKGNVPEFQYLLKLLRKNSQAKQRPKRLICISSMVTWNGRRGTFDLHPAVQNLPSRNSSESNLMELQNLCLDINNLNIGIQSFVVCSGLIYGYGQDQLFGYFKRALEQAQSLKVYGTGSNRIPTIHLEDLCCIVRNLAFTGEINSKLKSKDTFPRNRYFFAVDSSKSTQLELIKCIASSLGNGKIQQIPIQNAFKFANFDQMTLNFQQCQSPAIETWHSKQGLIANMQKIVAQFNLYRGLKPNKIFIAGPPAAGKSKIAEILEKAYGLPVLTVKRVLEELHAEQNPFANEIKIKLEEIRAVKVEEERKIFEEAKKKKKGKKDAADQFDPSKILPRLPQQDLIRVFKKRLGKSDCMNKGYILDGWPKTAKSCESLFTNQNKQLDEALVPNAVFVITATEEEVKQRVKALPQNVKETTHWNQQGTTRRFQVYQKHNQEGTPKIFFNGKVDTKQIPFNYDGADQFIKFIERNGPLGFKKTEKKAHRNEQQVQKKPINEPGPVGDHNQQEKDEDDIDHEQEASRQEDEQFDLEKLTEHEKQILNQKSRPIRQYLIDNVIPQITEGLLEICKETPRDPIAFLIKFLEDKETVKKKLKK